MFDGVHKVMLFEHVEMKSGVLNHWKNCYVFAAEVDPDCRGGGPRIWLLQL